MYYRKHNFLGESYSLPFFFLVPRILSLLWRFICNQDAILMISKSPLNNRVNIKAREVPVPLKKPTSAPKILYFLFFLHKQIIFEWMSIVWTHAQNLSADTIVSMRYLWTVQNGRHKSTYLHIFSHLINNLPPHVHHKASVDHIAGRQWLATNKRAPQVPPWCLFDLYLITWS